MFSTEHKDISKKKDYLERIPKNDVCTLVLIITECCQGIVHELLLSPCLIYFRFVYLFFLTRTLSSIGVYIQFYVTSFLCFIINFKNEHVVDVEIKDLLSLKWKIFGEFCSQE